jgi:LPXTG-motif cell wall-anchored protein
MAQHTKRARLTVLAIGLGVLAPLALTGSASAAGDTNPYPSANGTINGFSTGDFTFLDALSVGKTNLAQVSIAQSAAGVSNKGLQTTDTLNQDLLTSKSKAGKTSYARGAGVSLNLGQGANSVPQAQLVKAEATAPAPSTATGRLLNLPLSPVANVDVQPDQAQANTSSKTGFCVLGEPLSEGTSTTANADVLPATLAGINSALLSADGTVKDDSTEELDPNGHGSLGLNSVSTLNTAGIQLFKGVPGAQITIKVINPLILAAFAGGFPGTSKVLYGSNDGAKDVLSITTNGQTFKLTAEQLLGTNGLHITLPGLLKIQIGGQPTVNTSSNGEKTSAVADLVQVTVLGTATTSGNTSVGGPLAPILQPVLSGLTNALKSITSALGKALAATGINPGVDLRVGHFEAKSQVPAGGIHCGIPVKKTSNKDPVTAGDNFTVTISAHNPYHCTIRHVRVDDKITATGGVQWTVGATRPPADSKTNNEVIWNNIGDIAPGATKAVQVDIAINSDSAAGTMSDTAKVTGKCATGNANGTATVNLAGKFTLHGPRINPSSSPGLPNTGMNPLLPVAGGLVLMTGIGIAVARRRGVI